MVYMLLYDGTWDLKSGNILGDALEEIARFYKGDLNFITSGPGTWDVPRWRIVDNIVKENFNPNRDPNGQVRYEDIQDCIKKVPEVRNNPSSKKIILVESDLYYGDLSWCFGGCDGIK
jgi:hypothetical protein